MEVEEISHHSEDDEDYVDEEDVDFEAPENVVSTSELAERMQDRMFMFEIEEENLRCKKCDCVISLNNQNELFEHIATKHIDELKSTEKSKFPIRNRKDEDPTPLDTAICNFFSKYGISPDVVRELPFIHMICSLGNTNQSLPNPDYIDRFVQKMADNYYNTFQPSLLAVSPIKSITVDVFKQKNENFIAFSAHFFNNEYQRKNIVFAQKLPTLYIDAGEILHLIRHVSKMKNFTNVVTTNSVFEKEVFQTKAFETSYVCYFSYVSNFAEGLIRHEKFREGIQKLKGFFHYVRSTVGVYKKLRLYMNSQKAAFDLPETDCSKWTGVLAFLLSTLHLHQYLTNFSKTLTNCEYIDDVTHEELLNLHMMLSHVQNSVKKCSTPDSSISQIIPEVIDLEKFISSRVVSNDVKKCFEEVFTVYMRPLINQYRKNCYEYATFLDPQYAYDDEILPDLQWARIRRTLKENLIQIYVQKVALRSPSAIIENELSHYEKIIDGVRFGSSYNRFEWWAANGKQIPILFEKALMLLCSPVCAIDAEYFFGKRGKFNQLNGKMPFKKFNKWLTLAASQEKFRGRGCPENEPLRLEPIGVGITGKSSKRSSTEGPLPPFEKRRKSLTKGNITVDEEKIQEKIDQIFSLNNLLPDQNGSNLLENEAEAGEATNGINQATSKNQNQRLSSRIGSKSPEGGDSNVVEPSTSNQEIVVKDEPLDDFTLESMLMQPPPEKRFKMSPTTIADADGPPKLDKETDDIVVKKEFIEKEFDCDAPGTSKSPENSISETISSVVSLMKKSSTAGEPVHLKISPSGIPTVAPASTVKYVHMSMFSNSAGLRSPAIRNVIPWAQSGKKGHTVRDFLEKQNRVQAATRNESMNEPVPIMKNPAAKNGDVPSSGRQDAPKNPQPKAPPTVMAPNPVPAAQKTPIRLVRIPINSVVKKIQKKPDEVKE